MMYKRWSIPSCPSCQNLFEVSHSGTRERGRYRKHYRNGQPHVLDCGHSVCEECLRAVARYQPSFRCTLCQVETSIPEGGGEDGYKKILLDRYITGLISAGPQVVLPDNPIQFLPAGTSDSNSRPRGKHTIRPTRDQPPNFGAEYVEQSCEECLSNPSVWKCKQCSSQLCNSCFQELHKSKVLSRHEAIPLFQESGSRLIKKCEFHDGQLEFYCQDDDKIVCSHCIIVGVHQGHKCISLKDKNMEYLDELKELMENVNKVVKRLKKAEKVLATPTRRPNPKSSTVIEDIHFAFQHLHGILQIREQALVNKAEELCHIHNSPTEKLKIEITDTLKFANMLLSDANNALNSPQSFNMSILLQKLNHIANESPCYLIDAGQQEEAADSLNFEMDLNLVKQFYGVGDITGNTHVRYTLCNEKQLPATANLDCEEADENSDDGSEFSMASGITLSSKQSSTCELDAKLSLAGAQPDKEQKFEHFKSEQVIVTHINSPSMFFVHRLSTVPHLKELSKEINLWCEFGSAEHVTNVIVDDFVLAQYTSDDEWYRAQVLNCWLDPDSDTLLYKIQYIDFGNTEIVPLSRLRKMESKFLQLVMETTMKCSLHDISPVHDEWTRDATTILQQLVSNQPVNLIMFGEEHGLFQVDLRRPALLKDIKNDIPVSAREMLVLQNHAYYLSPDSKNSMARKRSLQNFLPDVKSRMHKTLKIVVCYVNTPHHFFVQRMGESGKYLVDLMFNLQDMYNSDELDSRWNVFYPQLGMPCVAQFSHDKQWYRARINSVPVTNTVKVSYVDFGNEESLPLNSIKKIADKFLKLPVQALNCSLMDIEPLDGSKTWPPEAVEVFMNIVNNKKLEVHVKEYVDDCLLVTLYENKADCQICINALLVQEGLAKSTGPNSTIVVFPKQGKQMSSPQMQSASPSLIADTTTVSLESFVVDWDMSNFNILKKPGMPDLIAVNISHTISPALFYAQLCGRGEDDLLKLMTDMQKSYKNTQLQTLEWKEGDLAAAIYSQDQRWYRVRIVAVDGIDVTVFLFDYGFTDNTQCSQLRQLMDRHYTKNAFSIPCTLTGIVPAGGTNIWTTTSCQFLRECVVKYDTIYLARKDSKQNNCVSVDLYAYVEEHCGALEPHVQKYISFTDELVQGGMALPVRRKSTSDLETNANIAPTSSPSEQLLNALTKCTEIRQRDPTLDYLNRLQDNVPQKQLPSPVKKPDTGRKSTPSATSTPKRTPKSSPSKPPPIPSEIINAEESDLSDFDEDTEEPFKCPEAVGFDVHTNGDKQVGANNINVQAIVNLPLNTQQTVWKKPNMPSETVVEGTITYIDFDGCFYFHTNEAKPTLDLIKSTLKSKYHESSPECHDLYWCLNEPCIVQYEIDSNWYRGQVKSITDKGVEVIFIDYGNTEVVPHHKLRKKLACTGFPRMSLKCTLHGIEPAGDALKNGTWDPRVLDFLHAETVEKQVTITLKESPVNEPLQVSMKMKKNGVVVEDYIIGCELGRKIAVAKKPAPPIDFCIKDSKDNNLTIDGFKPCPLPAVNEIIPILPIAVEFPRQVWFQRNRVLSPKTEYEQGVAKQCKALKKLNVHMNKQAESWPKLKTPKIGDVVCAKFAGNWYRASIRQLTPNGFMVLFVDYGNCDVLSKKEMRVLPDNMLELPMQAILSVLHQVVPKNGQWSKEIYEQLQASIAKEEKPLAFVKELGPPLKVDLLKKDDNGKMVHLYQDLIDNRIIMLVREKSMEEEL